MADRADLASFRQAVFCTCAGLFLVVAPSAVSAQQVGDARGASGATVPVGVAVEYATIGGMQIPIAILRPDSATAVGSAPASGGQSASNRQIGNSNTTVIDQVGLGNRATVDVTGDTNSATITQTGRNNVGQAVLAGNGLILNLTQDGNGNQASLGVTGGSGGSLTVQQTGNGNVATGTVPGSAPVFVSQNGSGLSADVSQTGAQKGFSLIQVGRR